MISNLPKIVTVLFLAGAAFLSVHADDILLNGDFTDGKTHWHGDGDAPDAGGRLVITLQPDRWTGVYQNFNAESATLQLKINYTVSDDCSLAVERAPDNLIPPLTASALMEATGLQNSIYSIKLNPYNSWMVALISGGTVVHQQPVHVKPEKGLSHYVTATLSSWTNQFADVNLCLMFPPGKGTVTLTSVTLLPPKGSAP
jgi:hypothetical protein